MNEALKHPETGAQVLVRTLEDAGVEFVFGFPGGTVISGATDLVRAFVEHHQMPTVATLKALGALPGSSELFPGMVGMLGSKAANTAVQECDLLLGIRSRISIPGDYIQELLVDIDCGERSPDVLMRQIDRLHDVISVSRYIRSNVEVDRQNLSFQAALPSTSGIIESVRRAPHE